MEKSEMMRYEEATGQTLEEADERGITLSFYLKYIQWLETKAEAYDRLMSGGRKTLQEYIEKYWDKQVIDFTVRLDGRNSFYIHPSFVSGDTFNFKAHGNCLETTYECTLPDGLEEK